MFVDTHCHLDTIADFGNEPPILNCEVMDEIVRIVQQAKQNNVGCIINVGCSAAESKNCVKLARAFDCVFAVVGIHPYGGKTGWKDDFGQLKKLVVGRTQEDKIVGVGEIGLDYSRKHSDKDAQKDLLRAQIELALEHDFPISFHVRDAADDFLKLVEPYTRQMRGAVIHCFQQDQGFADVVTKWGFYIGIDGPITYPKNESLREVIRNVDLSSIVLETDAPFLPVQQERGKTNYPSKIPLIAMEVARVKAVSLKEVEAVTTRNAAALFSLPSLT